MVGRGGNGRPLLRRILKLTPGLDAFDQALQILWHGQPGPGHGGEPGGYFRLRLVIGGQVAHLQARNLVQLHPLLLLQAGHSIQNALRLQAQQRRRGGDQLVLRQKHMPVSQIVAQLKEYPSLDPALIVSLHADGEGKHVHLSKAAAEFLLCQQVGILLHLVDGVFAEGAEQPDGQLGRQAVGGQKFDEPPDTHLLLQRLADLLRLGRGNPRQLGQQLRLVLDDLQGALPKALDDAGGGFSADALNHPGGQKGQNFAFGLRHHPFQELRAELAAIRGVIGPAAGNQQAFAHSDHGNGTHDGGHLAGFAVQFQDRVAVLLILEHHRADRPLQKLHLCIHVLRLTLQPLRPLCLLNYRNLPMLPGQQLCSPARLFGDVAQDDHQPGPQQPAVPQKHQTPDRLLQIPRLLRTQGINHPSPGRNRAKKRRCRKPKQQQAPGGNQRAEQNRLRHAAHLHTPLYAGRPRRVQPGHLPPSRSARERHMHRL